MQKALSCHCSRADGKVNYKKNHIILLLQPWKCIALTPTTGSLKILSHYTDVTMSAMASQITRVSIVCPIIYSGTGQRNHQSSASLPFVRGIHRSPVDPPHKGTGTRKMFSFDNVIMENYTYIIFQSSTATHFKYSGTGRTCYVTRIWWRWAKQGVQHWRKKRIIVINKYIIVLL